MPGKNRFGVIVSDRVAEVHEHDIPSVGDHAVLKNYRVAVMIE